MNVRSLWHRLRSQMPNESTVDPDLHTNHIAQEILRKQVAMQTRNAQFLIPETDKFLRRPVYDRFLRRRHLMPLKPPTPEEMCDAILILRDAEIWADEILVEAELIFREAGVEYSGE